jgi:hypothetical protein
MGHEAVFTNFRHAINSPPAMPLNEADCPTNGTIAENWAWNP